MFPNNRNILIFEDAKAFHPLKLAFAELGFQLVAAEEMEKLASLDDVIGYFACFYRCIDHPIAAWLRRKMLARKGIPVIAWNRDAPHYLNRPKWRLRLASTLQLVDIYATHTLIDTSKYQFSPTTVYLANALEPSAYAPPAPVSETFRHLRDETAYTVDVSFFGGINGVRYKEDAERARFFSALSALLKSKGISHVFRETDGMTPDQQIAFILSSKINLNYGARCEYNAPVASGLPERCFGIPGCGGFLLCDKRTHASDDFTIGENWAEFDGIDDCIAQIEHWLAHFEAARDLAERCHNHVTACHTYRDRAMTLKYALIAWHAREHMDSEKKFAEGKRD